ncbi:uncharacterized protein LOC124914900 [Impatiens glandulifera]|uniref:uncharacterized protein LOC124914900 n=1 Tax=Impatiens glandulifera TaxID=253017 RepID=UPI001FB11754|nr:uncharacterized protein LOC124914900 [Impatiens glandulifera]XP_047311482.1 uncharacterized protein LOC124914900 [Impatiens glandulifera]
MGESDKLQGSIVVSETNVERDEDNMTAALLPARKGGLSSSSSKKSVKPKRKVQWNDTNGNKLAEVKVFQPSDDSDSEEEDSDNCMCTIM